MRALIVILLSSTAASAGGFDRFQRDESLLFDAAGTVVDVTAWHAVAAGRYLSVDGRSERVDIGDDVSSGTLRIKVSPYPALACLASITEPFGTDLQFGDGWSRADVAVSQQLRVSEFGVTCTSTFAFADGIVAPLAGIAYDHLSFRQTREFSEGVVARVLDLESDASSWRAGLAYRHSASGMMASVVYYSAISFDVDGELRTQIVLEDGTLLTAPVHGGAQFPQSVRVDLSMPLAPDWLLAVAGQWSDWSSLDHVALRAKSASPLWSAGTELVDLKTYFRDGLTASVLLAHAWTPAFATWMRVSWDRATTTGWTEHTESWALQFGTKYKVSESVELTAAIAGIWSEDAILDRRVEGAPYSAVYDGELMLVPQLGLTSRF